MVSPSEKTAIHLSTFRFTSSPTPPDTRQYLNLYLKANGVRTGVRTRKYSRLVTYAEYLDKNSITWQIRFLSKPRRLLLVTCNTGCRRGTKEREQGRKIVESAALLT